MTGRSRERWLAVLLLGLTAAGPAAPAAAEWTVYLRRVGPVRIGMPLAEVRRVLGNPQARLETSMPGQSPEECSYVRSSALPEGIGVMFAGGRVVRIDVFGPNIRTASGAGIGDTEEKIKSLYPDRISVGPHKYEPEGHYLKFLPADAADQGYGIIFETDGKKVTSFRTGTRTAIALVEGCS